MLRIIAALIAAVFALGTLAAPVYAGGKEAPKTETKQPAKPAAPKKEPLDINSASEADLKALPGIGDARATHQVPAGRVDSPLRSRRC